MRYEVQTFTMIDGWVNCWTEDEQPLTFATEQEAQQAIEDHIADCEEFDIECDDEYRVAAV